MSFHRFACRSLLWAALVSVAAPLCADPFEHIVPPTPSHRGKFDLFAPPDLSDYGSGPPTNQGYFFNVDFLQWNFEAPTAHPIGSNLTVGTEVSAVVSQSPVLLPDGGNPLGGTLNGATINTFAYQEEHDLQSGRRLEGGWVEDEHGLVVSFFKVRDERQSSDGPGLSLSINQPPIQGNGVLIYDSLAIQPDTTGSLGARQGAIVVFPDSTFGASNPFAIGFENVTAHNIVKLSNIEVMGIHRYQRARKPYAGQFEWLYGVRYLNWDEEFNVGALFIGTLDPPTATALTLNDILRELNRSNNHWNTHGDNQLIGPQIGFRYFKPHERWSWACEGRFMPALNIQTITQNVFWSPGLLNSIDMSDLDVIDNAAPTNARNGDRSQAFSPVGELRLEGAYSLTRRIRLRAGWTGLYVPNLARPSNMVVYNFPQMGIDPRENKEDAFVHGLHLGLEVNH